MNLDRVKEANKKYRTLLASHGASPVRVVSDEEKWRNKKLDHLLWMCDELDVIIDAGRIEKAMRWLGFLQGSLWGLGLTTVENLKKDNMPPDAEFSRERV